MTDQTTEHQEETIASVRSEIELRAAEQAEAKRIAAKRSLLERVVAGAANVEKRYQTAKEQKKALKALRADLEAIDADDLDIQDLEELIERMKTALGYHDGGPVELVSVGIVAAPEQIFRDYANDPAGRGRKRA